MDTATRIFELADSQFKEQKAFAAAIGVSDKIVSQWRVGTTRSYRTRIATIADALGTTTEYLLTGEGPKKKSAPAVSASDTAKKQQAAAQKGSGLPEEFARLFMSLSPENQNTVIAEMLKRQREQGYRADQVPGEK